MNVHKICTHCAKPFEIAERDIRFYERVSPVYAGVAQSVSAPTLCPWCRFLRRAAHRNERHLYHNRCAKTGRSVISVISPDKPFTIFDREIWWGDTWNPQSYAREFDFGRPFFEQFVELRNQVPRLPLLSKSSVNSDYTNHASDNRDCYLSVIVFGSENVYYSRKVFSSQSVMDSSYIFRNGEELYECFWGENLYNCKFCTFCSASSDLVFCYDCRGCRDCFMSSNLRNAQYVFKNQQLSAETYREEVRRAYLGSWTALSALLAQYDDLIAKTAKPPLRLDNCEDVSGDFLLHCKDCLDCYYAALGEKCRYCVEFDRSADERGSFDCMDAFGFGASELLYEVQAQASGYHNLFCSWSYFVQNSLYLEMCFNISNCFGCVGLHAHEQYCVLNKQYSKAEYERLVPRIIQHLRETGEWGEFFPASISPYGFNESVAHEFLPLRREEALAQGYRWSDYKKQESDAVITLSAADIPDDVATTGDEIVQAVIREVDSGKQFRIIAKELEFYRLHRLALPRHHFDTRHLRRMRFRQPMVVREQRCCRCGENIQTTASAVTEFNIACNKCYLAALYGTT